MLEQAVHGADHTSDSSVFGDIKATVGEVQSNVNVATAEMNSARTRKQRSEADRRPARLTEKKSRLQIQLGQGKPRHLTSLSGVSDVTARIL
jgi:hypothetical protein